MAVQMAVRAVVRTGRKQPARMFSTKRELPSSLAACVNNNSSADLIALIAPQQSIQYSYGELDERARRLATGLMELGYKPGSVIISDVPNVAEKCAGST